MNNRPRAFWRLISIVGSIAFIVTIFGNGCGGYQASNDDYGFYGGPSQDVFGTGDVTGVSGEKTLAIAHFGNIRKSFAAMVNSTITSGFDCNTDAQVISEYNANAGSLSLDGQANTINAPLQMAIIKIAAEFADCAVERQSSLFQGINLGGLPNQYTADMVNQVGGRMALAFWGGAWDASFAADLNSAVQGIVSGAPNSAATTRQVAVGAATIMLASFYSIEM